MHNGLQLNALKSEPWSLPHCTLQAKMKTINECREQCIYRIRSTNQQTRFLDYISKLKLNFTSAMTYKLTLMLRMPYFWLHWTYLIQERDSSKDDEL